MALLRQLLLLCATVCMYGCFPAVKAGLLEYTQGTTYFYNYRTFTTVNEPYIPFVSNLTKDVGHTISTEVQMTPVWRSGNDILVKIVVTKPEIESFAHKVKQTVDYLSQRPFYFHWRSDIVLEIFAAGDDSTGAVNLKKGIASIFQVQAMAGEFTETDISGTCTVTYNKLRGMLEKTKTNCKTPEVTTKYNTVNQLLGVEPVVTRTISYVIIDNIVHAAVKVEKFSHKIGLQNSMGTEIALQQEFEMTRTLESNLAIEEPTLEAALKQLGKADGTQYKPSGLQAVYEETEQDSKTTVSIDDLLAQNRDKLVEENIGTGVAASVFSDLVEAFRTATQATILGVLKDEKNQEIVPVLIDTITASQTSAGQAALTDFLDFKDADNILLPERYLLAAAFSTQPTSELVQFLLTLYRQNVPNEKLRESIGEALGAVSNTFSQQMATSDSKLLKDVELAFLTSLKACTDSTCRLVCLRALLNAGLRATLPTILEYVEMSPDPDVSEAAIKALRRINTQGNTQVKEAMQRVFHQVRRTYDSTVRTCALSMLLTYRLTRDDLRRMLFEATDPSSPEFNLFVQARLFSKAKSDTTLREILKEVLEDVKLSNYNVLAQKGHGLAFTSDLAKTSSVAAMYYMYVETSKTGIMKRSGMDVELSNQEQTLPVYNFGIYTAGLEGLLGEKVEPGKEDIDATAGMSLELLGVSLRPITFFTGQASLLSAVWSAPAQLTSALQTNLLLQDYQDLLYLGNGLIAEVNTLGALSLDLSGSLTVSLWSKNAESLIRNSGGVAIRGSLKIPMEPLTARVEFSSQGENIIDFRTDVDFSDAVKMCLQMSRPEFVYYHNVTKYEGGRGFPKSYVTKERSSKTFNSVSFPLPPSNTEMCQSLLMKTD
ncbi:Microsomal triglyceride transfer protein large subunit [Lamellibrachia satsuma]|nr:Microsomal triglyceride transfer protein large subunit [Lamellibrachia satsuma]